MTGPLLIPEPETIAEPDSLGAPRPSSPPRCCTSGIWVIQPETGEWACSRCDVHHPPPSTGRLFPPEPEPEGEDEEDEP
jgi:hypothetical protein